MLEGEFCRRLINRLREHPDLRANGVVFRHTNWMTSGVPDFSVTLREHTLWVECKMLGNKPTKIQKSFLDKLARGAALITASVDGKRAVITPVEHIGWLTMEELADEIVQRVAL